MEDNQSDNYNDILHKTYSLTEGDLLSYKTISEREKELDKISNYSKKNSKISPNNTKQNFATTLISGSNFSLKNIFNKNLKKMSSNISKNSDKHEKAIQTKRKNMKRNIEIEKETTKNIIINKNFEYSFGKYIQNILKN